MILKEKKKEEKFMRKKLKYDLHTHTSYSDGDLDILGNVKNAIKLGLDGIAITDHDNIDGWEEIDNNTYKIDVLKGVELSTYYKGDSVHVLGYYLNDGGDYSELDSFLKKTREERLIRVKKIIELLKQYDIDVTYEEILAEADGAVARPHIAKAIIKKYPERGYTSTYLFDNYIGNDRPCYLPVNYFDTRDAIELLKRNHCLDVIAHPLLITKFDYKELAKYEIDGIEAIYNYQSDIKNDVLSFTLNNKLIVTGGSDYHGPVTRDSMGSVYLEGKYVYDFLDKINKNK